MELLEINCKIFGHTMEDNVLVVAFAEDESNEDYLMVQFSEELDEQDLRLATTRYFLDSSFAGGASGCISKVELTDGAIIFTLNSKGIRQFGVSMISVQMNFSREEVVLALKLIGEIFEGEPNVTLVRHRN